MVLFDIRTPKLLNYKLPTILKHPSSSQEFAGFSCQPYIETQIPNPGKLMAHMKPQLFKHRTEPIKDPQQQDLSKPCKAVKPMNMQHTSM